MTTLESRERVREMTNFPTTDSAPFEILHIFSPCSILGRKGPVGYLLVLWSSSSATVQASH